MHTATQIIAQRAPPASRSTKAARWQPYYSLQTTASSLPLRSPHLNTPPASTVSSPQSPPPSQTLSSDFNRSRPPIPTPTAQPPKENLQRDSSKHKFTSGLIDQTVQILSDIWHPQDIPACFLPPVARTGVSSLTPSPLLTAIQALNSKGQSSSLSLPLSPSTQPHSDLGQSAATPTTALALLASEADSDQAILPLKTFVHEVLRRSRTSGNVLQAALCYLEAIRPKVPEILQQENVGIRAGFQPESRIQPATPAELEREVELCALEVVFDEPTIDDPLKTVRITDSGPDELDRTQQAFDDNESSYSLMVESSSSIPSALSSSFTSSPFTALPSPLLCPRRAFLASLILASKFSQDKSYSNRAWAKLSGLPPREVGRCERALGQALQWRLWVGKTPVALQLDTPLVTSSRSVVRSQSESSVTPSKPFLCEDLPRSQTECPPEPQPHKVAVRVGLRRCSTLPADLLRPSSVQPTLSTNEDSGMDAISMDSQQDCKVLPLPVDTKGSPEPTTPGLSDSPSSTDCSDDRTIHMSDSALDENVFDGNLGKAWLGDSVCHTESPLAFIGGHCGYNGQDFHHPISVVDIDASIYGPNFYWNTDNYYILESAGVH